MFTGAIMHLPGQELRTFEVFRDGEIRTPSGRIISNDNGRLGEIKAVLAAAKPEEIERWASDHTQDHPAGRPAVRDQAGRQHKARREEIHRANSTIQPRRD